MPSTSSASSPARRRKIPPSKAIPYSLDEHQRTYTRPLGNLVACEAIAPIHNKVGEFWSIRSCAASSAMDSRRRRRRRGYDARIKLGESDQA
jgi:hypothetical protein